MIQRYCAPPLRRKLISERRPDFRGSPRLSAHLSHEMTAHIRCLTVGRRCLGPQDMARDVSQTVNPYENDLISPPAAHTKGRFVEGYTCFGENQTARRERMVRQFSGDLSRDTRNQPCLLIARTRRQKAECFSWRERLRCQCVRPRWQLLECYDNSRTKCGIIIILISDVSALVQ